MSDQGKTRREFLKLGAAGLAAAAALGATRVSAADDGAEDPGGDTQIETNAREFEAAVRKPRFLEEG